MVTNHSYLPDSGEKSPPLGRLLGLLPLRGITEGSTSVAISLTRDLSSQGPMGQLGTAVKEDSPG